MLKRLFALNKSRAEAAKAAKATTPAPKGRGGQRAKTKRAMGRGICFKAYVSGTPTGLKMGVEALNPPVVDTRQPGATRQNA